MAKTKEQIIQNVKNDAVSFAVNIANDNSHGYSQRIRSLYEINIPKSFDCSSLALTAYYYAFLKNGLTKQARYLKENCSYTGNMLKMLNAGFEVVARNQTAHKQMIKGDLELADNNSNGSNSHVAMAIDKNNIVHARSSEGTADTKDNSGNEIRTQPGTCIVTDGRIVLDLLEKGLILVDLPILLEVSLPQNHQLAQNHQRPHRKEPVICLSQN